MGRYIIRRLIWMVFVLLFIIFITYVIFFLLPAGNPILRFVGRQPTPEIIREVTHQFGLDHPWYIQYLIFTKHIFFGDQFGWPGLGESFITREALKSELFQSMLVTLQLALGAAVVWLIVGIPIGILSALRPRSIFDRVAMFFALLGISAPVFVLGPVALLLFWFKWHLISGTGYVPPTQNIIHWFGHMILPWCVLALLYAAFYSRMTRANLMETMSEDHIRTARAKGISESRVVLKHGLRAGLTPIVTIFGLDLATLLGGAVITETIFNLPGLGHLLIMSLGSLDLYTIVDITVVAAFFVTFANIIVDVVYAFLDPRVRYT